MRKDPHPTLLALLGVLLGLLNLSACGPLQTSVEPTHEQVTATSTTAAAVPPTVTVSPTFTRTAVTRVPASTPAAETAAPTSLVPPPTEASPQPQVLSFGVFPTEVDLGDEVVLTWEAIGERAVLCPSARFVLFTNDDCRVVAPSGAITFTIPLEAAGFQFIHFSLTARAEDATDSSPWQVSVALKCPLTWFFSDEPQAGICPTEPVESAAAAQRFERGTMIWLQQPGRYYVLEDALLHEQDVRKQLGVIQDPLEVVRDTSSGVIPPEGLYAPVSGFGLLWRGDVAGIAARAGDSTGYREALGWALVPEFTYDAILQCDDALPSGGRSWQTCYLKGPGDEIIVLHPLGGWYRLGER